MIIRWVLIVTVGLIGMFFGLRALVAFASSRPQNLGVTNGRLAPCPATPNCVSTFEQDATHSMAPLPLLEDPSDAQQRLIDIINGMPRSKIITNKPAYLHAEFRSSFWAFVDDVEFFIDERTGQVHFRAAARLGRNDFDANRQRMEEIRQAYDRS